MLKKSAIKLMWLLASITISMPAFSAAKDSPLPETFADNKVVIQLSDYNPQKQQLVLNVTGNLIKYFDGKEVDIEVVTFGPGVRLLMKDNPHSQRIQALMDAGVRFSVCGNTLTNMEKQLGYRPVIREGVMEVEAGAGRILQLNKAGWQVLKP
ncbi:MAG: DsrE family protein [Thiomicrospira sp.]|uniref:DsrE family protein n=1 Tax=Thiomicrospira sp. TaxID=935 RepID=UPI001A058441|nr:DsrE family protein [Thiomicrospira sp.]MBE0494657.1 DsrE family protein [Thiomicrospira sp.]